MSVCVFFLLSSQCRLSLVSVMFDFNDSLNDVAPLSLKLFPVDVKGRSDSLMCVYCLFSIIL